MHIEQANHEDYEVVANIGAIEDSVFQEASFGERTIRKALETGYCAVLKDSMDVVVAYAMVMPDKKLHDLLRLGVMPGFQNRGYGTWLLAHVLEKFPGDMMLMVRKNNTIAKKMYEKKGFCIVATTGNSWVMIRKATSMSS